MKVNIKNLQGMLPIPRNKIRRIALKTNSLAGRRGGGEITICFLDDNKIKGLNRRYLGKDCPTDVISFNLADPRDSARISADIAISTQRAICNAKIFRTTPSFEVCLYVIHGILHLFGYNDTTPKEKRLMEGITNLVLNALKL